VVVVVVAVRVVVADVVGVVVVTGTVVVGAVDPVVVAGPVVGRVVAGGVRPADVEGAALPASAGAMGPRSADNAPGWMLGAGEPVRAVSDPPADVVESLTTSAAAPSTNGGPSTVSIRIGSG
jgi:hypothetical protein